jgi:hypothetical protein
MIIREVTGAGCGDPSKIWALCAASGLSHILHRPKPAGLALGGEGVRKGNWA